MVAHYEFTAANVNSVGAHRPNSEYRMRWRPVCWLQRARARMRDGSQGRTAAAVPAADHEVVRREIAVEAAGVVQESEACMRRRTVRSHQHWMSYVTSETPVHYRRQHGAMVSHESAEKPRGQRNA